MEEMACLYFVERNDNIFEENNMLFPQGYSKTRNNTGQDVQKFRCSIEYVRRNGQSYTNLTAQTWKHIPKPLKKAYEPKPERDDDYFVPTTEDRFDTDRRYEGFPAA